MAAPLRRSTRGQGSTSLVATTTASVSSTRITAARASTITSSRARKRAKIEVEVEVEEQVSATDTPPSAKPKPKASRVPKAKVASALRPEEYPTRASIDWKVGAHVSAAGGVENAILNAASIGANAFALFVKSQRKWTSPSLTEESIGTFKARLLDFGYAPDLVLPHGSYLINLGNPDEEKREKSYECFLDDLRRCEQLGLTRYNFHPGSTVGLATPAESIAHIATCLNRAHKATSTVMTVIENMAGSGNVLGSRFEEIAQIIERIEDKTRVGVCLDTCHTFAAGYDIRSQEAYEATLSSFDRTVGLSYLRGMHLNDSKTPLASHKDRHDNIGRGHIGLPPFQHIMHDPRLRNIPLILETPTNEDSSVWAKEIEVLNELSMRPPDGEEGMQSLVDAIGEAVAGAAKDGGKGKGARKGGAVKGGKYAKRKRVEEPSSEESDDA